MVELALNPSETRAVPRDVSRKSILRPVLLAGLGAGALAGVAMAASSVIGDLVAAPKRAPTVLRTPAAVQSGIASQWPDLKDGLPAVVGVTVKTATARETPATPEPTRMASLPDPIAAIPTLPAKASAPANRAEAPPARVVAPTERIPVPTEIATQAAPAATKLVMPTRTAALLPPRETIRAQDDTPKSVEEAAHAPAPVKAQAVAAKAPPLSARAQAETKPHQEAARTREAAAKPPVIRPAPVAATAPTPSDKNKKVAAAHKAAPDAAKPTVVATAGEAEETNILGVKLPSLAPAGRKISEGVSALKDAVQSVF